MVSTDKSMTLSYMRGYLAGLVAAKSIILHNYNIQDIISALCNAIDQAEIAIPKDENYLKTED